MAITTSAVPASNLSPRNKHLSTPCTRAAFGYTFFISPFCYVYEPKAAHIHPLFYYSWKQKSKHLSGYIFMI